MLAVLALVSSCGKQGPEAQSPGGAGAAALPATRREIVTPSGAAMVFLPGGEFLMGTSQGNADEGPVHKVRISSFMMDQFPVTHEMFRQAQLPDPSRWQDNPQGPVERVRWRDAKQYCNERSLLEGLKRCYNEKTMEWDCDYSANGYRLPTEAEWEYACRAGRDGPYDFGPPDKLPQYAWFADNADRRTHPVGQKKPNLWGLYDMYGNVCEWCEDVYSPAYYEQSAPVDPHGPPSPGKDVKRVLRGGSWNASAAMCRATFRQGQRTGDTDACFFTDFCGFRCVRRVSAEELQSLRTNSR